MSRKTLYYLIAAADLIIAEIYHHLGYHLIPALAVAGFAVAVFIAHNSPKRGAR